MTERVSLQPVDAANVTVLVDNFIYTLLPSGEESGTTDPR